MASKNKSNLKLSNTVYSVINDAYLMLDGDTSPVEVDTTAYDTAIRLLRIVQRKVMKYRKWSFLRKAIHGQEGDNCIGCYVKVLRVYDKFRRPFHQVYHTNFLKGNEYYIWDDMLTTGKMYGPDKSICIEVQVDEYDITKPMTEIDERLYSIMVLGLCTELCKIDQGGFQAMAGDREADFQEELDTTAKQDMLEVGDSVLFDAPPTLYARRGVVI
jgi:hypothetical protein